MKSYHGVICLALYYLYLFIYCKIMLCNLSCTFQRKGNYTLSETSYTPSCNRISLLPHQKVKVFFWQTSLASKLWFHSIHDFCTVVHSAFKIQNSFGFGLLVCIITMSNLTAISWLLYLKLTGLLVISVGGLSPLYPDYSTVHWSVSYICWGLTSTISWLLYRSLVC
jgi:hypothetical protein